MNAYANQDSSELEALFAAAANGEHAGPSASTSAAPLVRIDSEAEADAHDVFHRIGTSTRTLHDALRELG